MRSAFRPCPSKPAASTFMRPAGVAVIARAQPPRGLVELRDTDCLRENLDRIEVAVGVERIAGVIASDGDGDARSRKFVQQGYASPARRSTRLLAILQIHVAHRERDDRDAGRGHTGNRAFRISCGPAGEAATMTGGDTSLPAEANGRFRNRFKRVGVRIVCLVGVKIEIEVAVARQSEDAIERWARIRIVDNNGTQDTAVISNEVGKAFAFFNRVTIKHGERNTLQGNAARPAIAHLRQYRPADRALPTHRIDVRADGGGAVDECAAQRKIHARGDVLGAPPRFAILGDKRKRVLPAAARVGNSKPGLAFVEMRMKIGAHRPDHATLEIESRQAGRDVVPSRRSDPRANDESADFSAGDCEGGGREFARLGITAVARIEQAERYAGVDQPIVIG